MFIPKFRVVDLLAGMFSLYVLLNMLSFEIIYMVLNHYKHLSPQTGRKFKIIFFTAWIVAYANCENFVLYSQYSQCGFVVPHISKFHVTWILIVVFATWKFLKKLISKIEITSLIKWVIKGSFQQIRFELAVKQFCLPA